MSKMRSRLIAKLENKPVYHKVTRKENTIPSPDEEIECPSCHDTMALCSDFDSFCYLCGECDFILYFE